MLRAREIRPYGSPAKYPNLDLGRDQGTGRGDVIASFCRPKDGQFECFTFVPDTLHNRVQLLLKSAVELAEQAPYGTGWKKLTWADLEPLLAPVEEEPKAAPEPEPVVHEPEAVPPALAGEASETLIGGLEDFLQLSKRDQLAAVMDPDFPEGKLSEVVACMDGRLSEKVRDAALKKVERLQGVSQ